MAHILSATLHLEYLAALGQEHRQNLDSLLHNAAAIATIVEHQTAQTTRLAQSHQLAAQIGSAALAEIVMGDVADRVVQPTCIGNARNRDSFAGQRQIHHTVIDQACNLQAHLRTGVAFQAAADLIDRHTLGRLAVDLDDAVANLDARTVGGATLIGLGKAHVVALLANQRAHTAILTRGHHLELGNLLLGHIHRIGVERRGHTIGSTLHQLCGVGLIDIEDVQLAHHIDQHLDIASQRKVITGRGRQHHRHSHRTHHRQQTAHGMFRVLRHSLFSYKFPSDR